MIVAYSWPPRNFTQLVTTLQVGQCPPCPRGARGVRECHSQNGTRRHFDTMLTSTNHTTSTAKDTDEKLMRHVFKSSNRNIHLSGVWRGLRCGSRVAGPDTTRGRCIATIFTAPTATAIPTIISIPSTSPRPRLFRHLVCYSYAVQGGSPAVSWRTTRAGCSSAATWWILITAIVTGFYGSFGLL